MAGTIIHAMASTKTYKSWMSMKSRCYNPNSTHYYLYGGRGIKVCKRWRDSFANFYKDMGTRPEGRTLERIDVNKGYSPRNCTWATPSEQARNRRDTIVFTLDGTTMAMHDWADELGVNPATLKSRYYRGWSDEEILTRSVQARRNGRSRNLKLEKQANLYPLKKLQKQAR